MKEEEYLKLKDNTPDMFDDIAGNYDKINQLMSFRLDKRWRRKLVDSLSKDKYDTILDLACGTGELSLELKRVCTNKQYGIDPSIEMLNIAKSKTNEIEFIQASGENIPLDKMSVDLITVSFGIRNFKDLSKSFSECYRILRTDGEISIMEFSIPKNQIVKIFYYFHINVIIPIIGKLISKKHKAYKYLPQSIIDFGKNVSVLEILKLSNFDNCKKSSLLFGMITIYQAKKII